VVICFLFWLLVMAMGNLRDKTSRLTQGRLGAGSRHMFEVFWYHKMQ
jgi:hypothetical protein